MSEMDGNTPGANRRKKHIITIAIIVIFIAILLFVFLRRINSPVNDPTTTPSNPTSGTPGEPNVNSGGNAPENATVPTGTPAPAPGATSEAAPATPADLTADATTGLSKASVVLKTGRGDIKFKFYTNDAPNTTKRIAELIQQGFYNGLTFHRVESGALIQGGDPIGNGTGGSGVKLKAEFNARKHIRGTVAMARRGNDDNSADSQFYIMLRPMDFLDGKYTVLGQVTEGMEVADKIERGDIITQAQILAQ